MNWRFALGERFGEGRRFVRAGAKHAKMIMIVLLRFKFGHCRPSRRRWSARRADRVEEVSLDTSSAKVELLNRLLENFVGMYHDL